MKRFINSLIIFAVFTAILRGCYAIVVSMNTEPEVTFGLGGIVIAGFEGGYTFSNEDYQNEDDSNNQNNVNTNNQNEGNPVQYLNEDELYFP